MKTNKNLKIVKKGVEPLKLDGESVKNTKLHKDKSTKRRLSIYDDFAEEDLDSFDLNYRDDDQFDEE